MTHKTQGKPESSTFAAMDHEFFLCLRLACAKSQSLLWPACHRKRTSNKSPFVRRSKEANQLAKRRQMSVVNPTCFSHFLGNFQTAIPSLYEHNAQLLSVQTRTSNSIWYLTPQRAPRDVLTIRNIWQIHFCVNSGRQLRYLMEQGVREPFPTEFTSCTTSLITYFLWC